MKTFWGYFVLRLTQSSGSIADQLFFSSSSSGPSTECQRVARVCLCRYQAQYTRHTPPYAHRGIQSHHTYKLAPWPFIQLHSQCTLLTLVDFTYTCGKYTRPSHALIPSQWMSTHSKRVVLSIRIFSQRGSFILRGSFTGVKSISETESLARGW